MTTKSEKVSDWGNEAYSGLSSIGSFKANLSLICVGVISVVLIISGIYLISTNDDNKYVNVNGIVTEPGCTKTDTIRDKDGNVTNMYKCNLEIKYNYNNADVTKTIFTTRNTQYVKNEPIELMIDKNDPNNVQIATLKKSILGSILLAIAVVISGCAYLNYYMTNKYKIYAAAQGTSTVFDIIR